MDTPLINTWLFIRIYDRPRKIVLLLPPPFESSARSNLHSDSTTLEECLTSPYKARLAIVAIVGLMVTVGNSNHANCTILQVKSLKSSYHATPLAATTIRIARLVRESNHRLQHLWRTSDIVLDDRFPSTDVFSPVLTVEHSGHYSPLFAEPKSYSANAGLAATVAVGVVRIVRDGDHAASTFLHARNIVVAAVHVGRTGEAAEEAHGKG
ncbi:hypothetical protein K438DRAFT_1763997 [Mycena galopus ATCC 62051]|nr:hypothetical protein K438DRAFT_1763997 [Mycena galopus ATCC 62051]